MIERLLFFERGSFAELRELKSQEGYQIRSLSEFFKDKKLIPEIDPDSEIVDISPLSSYNEMQAIAEDHLFLFDSAVLCIADRKCEETFRYELRYCFETFEEWAPLIKNNLTQAPNTNSGIVQHKKITELSAEDLVAFTEAFRRNLYGHEKFKDDFVGLIETFKIFNKIGEHKILSLFLLGESGVGKTEVANAIYRCLGGKKRLAKVNFGNYSSEFSLSSLIGSARGYIGSEDGEIFIRIRDTDVGVILIDEFEKSNATLFNYFLDVLESGKVTSSMTEEIDLNGFIIIFTSNISKEDFAKRISPELRSRFDYKGQFTLLYDEDKKKYVEFRVQSIVRKVNDKYNSSLSDNLHEYFLEKIKVSEFQNMRDLNKEIKKMFVQYISENRSANISEVSRKLRADFPEVHDRP